MKRTPDEKSQEFAAFWKLERDKCKYGIYIDTQFISGFLYYHLNFFKCQLDILDDGRIIRKLANPYLRDNEWIIDNYIRQAEEAKKGLCVLGSRRLAKALRNDELLYTKNGTIPIGEASIGDEIFDPFGKLTTITGVFPQGKIQTYKITLEDNREIFCCENHLWEVLDKRNKKVKVLSTKELLTTYKSNRIHNGYKDGITRNIEEKWFAIQNNKPVEYEEKEVSLDPYFLGLWLGDGNSRNTGITTIDSQTIKYLESFSKSKKLHLRKEGDTYFITPNTRGGNKKDIPNRNFILSSLKELNLIKNKHIPNVYLYNSKEIRLSVLQGLMDTDGSCTTKEGMITFVTTSKQLSDDFYFLCRSLGINLRKQKFISKLYGKECGVGWKFTLFTELPVFRLKRKLNNIRIGNKRKQFKINYTTIRNIELADFAESTCIMVDNESKLFLTTNFTTTHNSVFEASYISHRATFYKGTQNVIAGLNEPDIKVITDLVDESLVNLPLAFKKGRIEDNWKKQVTLGKKTLSGERISWSSIPIRNLDGGKNTEALAGLSPFSMVIDEIGKGDWLKAFSAAIPGFSTPYGWRCSPLAFGTSGDMEKAKDAQKVFESPEAYNFLCVELPENNGKKTSVFISGHYAHDFPKDTIPLSKYLNKEGENLDKIDIQVTNFERSEKMIAEERQMAAKSNDISALLKLTMYHPRNIDELFLTDSNNNFPIAEIEQWQTYLKSNYDPIVVDLYRGLDGKVTTRTSTKGLITEFPVKPSSQKDAGVLIIERPISGLPFGTYVGGLDLYNQNESSDRVNSLGSYIILKRVHDPLGEFQYHIVASYSARPNSLKEFKENVCLMMEYYNAYTLVEYVNTEAIDWFIEKGYGHYLADGVPIAKMINPKTSSLNTKGLKATSLNQSHYMNLQVDYAKEELTTEKESEIIKMLGCTRVYDSMLLEEWKNYKSKPSSSKGIHDGNFDRIISFGHALTLARHLDKHSPISVVIKEEEYRPNIIVSSGLPLHRKSSPTRTKNSILSSPFRVR